MDYADRAVFGKPYINNEQFVCSAVHCFLLYSDMMSLRFVKSDANMSPKSKQIETMRISKSRVHSFNEWRILTVKVN